MKKSVLRALALSAALLLLLSATGCSNSDTPVVRVYNWGDYISPEVVELFEKETGIKATYDTFETNEDMYLKLKNTSGYSYDVVIPSDYMITKMLREDMLAEINFDNIPNYAGLDSRMLGLEYDPDNMYSVPYMWGTVCIAYDPEVVTEPVDSWNILWDDQYAGRMFMIDSERDSIGVALLSMGFSINTTSDAELELAKQKLLQQKPMVLAYTGDDIKDKLIGREGVLGVIWSCDIGIILEEDDSLAYVIPEEGTNIWYDAAVILKTAENKENGEKFIDFLCRPDVALLNADYLGSVSPVLEAAAEQDEEILNNPVVNPSAEKIEKYEIFIMPEGMADTYARIWSDVLAS